MPVERKIPGLSVSQRKALRQYAKAHPYFTQKQLQGWFETQFQRLITQPTISESLSAKYSFLDSSNQSLSQSRQRFRAAHWPELEKALFQWCQRIEIDGAITGDLIKKEAARYWKRLPQYQGMEVPVFSNGWLQGFKQRHGIKSRARHGEAGSVDIQALEEQLVAVRAIVNQYSPADCYNCDETGLFYKLLPDRSLATQQIPGQTRIKARLTAHFCTNADGSDKLPLWVIGKAAKPRCFGAASIQLSALDCVYKSNSKAWMTADIMVEWLHWFSKRTAHRRVLLVMDNFSAHTLALQIIQSQQLLQNVTVVWLPPNTTSKSQPLDQGIIYAFKAHYRRRWLDYVLNELELNRQPLRTTNILKAIRWSIQAWHEVTTQTIQHCWYHSTLLERSIQPSNEVALASSQVISVIEQLQQQQRIASAMSIEAFLNPEDECVQDSPDHIFEQVAQQFDPPEPEESEDEEPQPKISYIEALQALEQLRLYELQQSDGKPEVVNLLDQQEALIRQRQAQKSRQPHITQFFT